MAGVIRRASPDDAGVLCALAERTFVETFGHLYPPQDLADYLASAYPPELQRRQLQSGEYAAWLLEVGGEPVGFAFAGPCGLPHADARPGDGELKRLYVLRGHQGGGSAEETEDRRGPRQVEAGPRDEDQDPHPEGPGESLHWIAGVEHQPHPVRRMPGVPIVDERVLFRRHHDRQGDHDEAQQRGAEEPEIPPVGARSSVC